MYNRKTSSSASTPQECINYCKSSSSYEEQYTYAVIQSTDCWCGNAPPFIESSSCTYSCSGDSSKTCGGSGSSATFYSIPNQSEFFPKNNATNIFVLEQLCEYGLRDATGGSYLVRHIRTSKSGNYFNYQHCWAQFVCPKGRHAEYKISSSFELESSYDYATLYGKYNKRLTVISSSFSSFGSWLSLDDPNITFEFRSDHSNVYIGIDMELRCISNS